MKVVSDTPRQQCLLGILSHKHIIYPSVCEHPSPASLSPPLHLFHSSLFLFASLSQYLTSQVTETQCRSVLRFVGVRKTQLAHQRGDLTSEMDTYANKKKRKALLNRGFPEELHHSKSG